MRETDFNEITENMVTTDTEQNITARKRFRSIQLFAYEQETSVYFRNPEGPEGDLKAAVIYNPNNGFFLYDVSSRASIGIKDGIAYISQINGTPQQIIHAGNIKDYFNSSALK